MPGVEIDWSLAGHGPNLLGNFMQGLEAARGFKQQRATDEALKLYATDPDAAIQKLAAVDPARAQQLYSMRNSQADRQARVSAAGSYAKGDSAGAINALAPTGDIAGISALQDQVRQQHAATAAATRDLATRLSQYGQQYGPDKMLQQFDAMAPTALGGLATPEELSALRQKLATDPQGTLSVLANPRELEYRNAGDSVFIFDKATGQKVGQYQGRKYVNVRPGDMAVPVGDGADGQPAGGAPNAMAPGGPASAGARGVRNNNYLNLTTLPNGQWNGQTGADGRFAVFGSPEAGMAAADKNLQAYSTKHGINTLSGIINRWAPSSENNTGGYIQTVSQSLGVDPNQPLNLADPSVRRNVLDAMAKVEVGGSPPKAGGMGTNGIIYGQPKAPAQGGAQPAPQISLPPEVTGPAVLKALPQPIANQVQALAEGRMPFPGAFALKSPYWQQMLQAVSQYDPTFDAVNYSARSKTRNDFTSGRSANDVKSLNTAIGHLGELSQRAEQLRNTPLPAFNKVANAIATQSGDGRFNKFETAKDAVADEMTRVFRGTGGSVHDIESWKKKLNAAASPEQLRATVQEAARLLQSRVEALQENYRKGMGTTATTIPGLSPHAVEALQKLEGVAQAKAPAGGAQPSAPKVGAVVRGFRYKGGDPGSPQSWQRVS